MPKLNPTPAQARILMCHAPAGSGKTYVAGTLSEYFVHRPVNDRKELIVLKDLMWMQFDRDGLQTLQALGLEPFYLDLSAQPVDALSFLGALIKRLDTLPALMKEHGCKWLVVDTLSAISTYMDTFFLARNAATEKPNAQRAYGESQAVFRQIVDRFKALPCPQLWLCHSRSAYIAETDPMEEVKQAQAKATRPGKYDVGLGLTPGNATYVQSFPSLTVAVEVGENSKRSLVTREGNGYYVKNRYGDLLQAREEPNFRKLLNKVEAIEAQFASATVDNKQ